MALSDKVSEIIDILDNDAPLDDVSQDVFHFDNFARELANTILSRVGNNQSCFTFGLWGAWGSGKTSFLYLVRTHLKAADHCKKQKLRLVEYNPWWFSDEERMIRGLFAQIAKTGPSISPAWWFRPHWRGFLWMAGGVLIAWQWLLPLTLTKTAGKLIASHLFGFLGLLLLIIPFVIDLILSNFDGGLADYLDAVSDFCGAVSGPAGSAFRGLSKYARILSPNIEALRETVTRSFENRRFHTLVIIDDLDRLPPADVVRLLTVIKGVTDLPNVTYLLLADRDHVTKALESSGIPDAGMYLEKIVQYSAYLPAPTPDELSLFFRTRLLTLLEPGSTPTKSSLAKFDIIENLCYLYFKTPRDVKRVMNVIRVTYPLCKKSAAELKIEIVPMDFVTLQMLQLFDRELYVGLRNAARASDFNILSERFTSRSQKYVLGGFNILGHARDNRNDDTKDFWYSKAEFELYFRYSVGEPASIFNTGGSESSQSE